MSKLIVQVPDKDTPGYLRRLIKSDELRTKLNETEPSPEYFETLFQFLLTFVIEPEDRDEAKEMLLDASKQQYLDLLSVINKGGVENPTQAAQNETS